MIQNLLTALGVAALSIQTPNNITHEEPKRAYYDSSAVAEYGTGASTFYNYSSVDFAHAATGENYTYNWSGVEAANTSKSFFAAEVVTASLDFYVNGEYYGLIAPVESGDASVYYVTIDEDLRGNPTGPYIWIFDHYTAPMSQTIIETAGDATTAAAAVIGSGISGVISLFYNDGITGLGILSLIMAGVALVWFALSLVMKLWRRR